MSNNLRELELNFIGKGEVKFYNFRQIRRTEYGYIYQVTHQDGSVYFEIFKRKINQRFNCVRYPLAKHFGNWAYTTKRLKRADEILKQFANVPYNNLENESTHLFHEIES